MHISTSSSSKGDIRTMTVVLQGDDGDFLDLIDQGSGLDGVLGILAAKIATQTGLVAERSDTNANAARLLRRAADLLDQDR